MSLTAFTLAWLGASTSYLPPDPQREEPTAASTVDAVVERIIDVESGGDPNAKNKRSSATGLGQFLDETWLDMIRAHRPDLAKARSQAEILELRRDAKIAREITARFTERNAGMREFYSAIDPCSYGIRGSFLAKKLRGGQPRDGTPESPRSN